jgi:membrane AbrB-like protein
LFSKVVSGLPRKPQSWILVVELLTAVAFGAILQLAVGRIGWLFGGMMAGLVVFIGHKRIYSQAANPSRFNRTIGQMLVGLAIGYSMSESDLGQLAGEFPIYIFLTLFAIGSGILIAFMYARRYNINLLTSLLATMPGGVSIMATVAAEYDKDVMLVSTLQLARILSVVVVIPLWVNMTAFQENLSGLEPEIVMELGRVILLVFVAIVCAAVGSFLAQLCRIPVAPMFGSMISGLVFGSVLTQLPAQWAAFTLPALVIVSGQVLMGTSIGESMSKQPATDWRVLFGALQVIALTLVAGVLSAALIKLFTSWSWLTCILATAPGGASEMVIISLIFDQNNVGSVTSSHLVRLMAINGLLPLWILLFRHLDRRFPMGDPGIAQ